MTGLLAQATVKGPHINWDALSPLIALTAGACIVLLVGLARSSFIRRNVVPVLTLITLGVTAGLGVWQWDVNEAIVAKALVIDNLTLTLMMIFVAGGIAAVLLAWRSTATAEAGEGEYFALLLTSILGMVVLVAANDLVVLFIGFELLSIPLYVLCATHMRREQSLESGLKYLIIGSVGSATLLYGLALLYGAAGGTNYADLAAAGASISDDVLFLTGVGLVMVGLAFKASVAPFHQWTPDVYEGAPTPVTGFMAVATKAAAFGVILRLFDVALIDASATWAPAFATLAVITIIVGNVGAIGQSSLKRMLAYSSVAQAGYMLAGVVVTTQLGISATVFYLMIYVVMNLAAFAVITAREREAGIGDDISSLYGLGRDRPLLAWPMTIAMLALAGFPATAGFFGKLYLINAAVDNGYAWLGIVIVLGSAVSLAYYLRVVAAVWMRSPSEAPAPLVRASARPVIAGGSAEADDEARAAGREPGATSAIIESDFDTSEPVRRTLRQPEVVFVAVVCALVTLVFGIYPEPLFNVAKDAGDAIQSLL
ncbi:NADH-quinone oxidoreductase subunit N [Solirubrobacter ginsenosidimutans]|uniref:NADH-quinone oxidoreductase subunit N n=1 Tax=Solirubrobacter ginsenosidimutans TaxID=490573 RepID=A0A9X3MMI9_9ACTN|nr:NADH-quinone oxidoreductase subunit N [Solirubrobacter ginsenosidimutans]MDA0159351.1 NADH-quinone oxidoreductase subunit N [Solirubrobacter ginsenosidimutans]